MLTPGQAYHYWRRWRQATRHLAIPLARVDHFNCTAKKLADPDVLDLVSVAFNNDRVIRHQHRLLLKNLQDRFCYTVADNSSDAQTRHRLRAFCAAEGIAYLALPPFQAPDGSASHGQALNWLWRNYIKPRKPRYFGFLDHDVFPVYPTAVVPWLKRFPVFGRYQERGDLWYLWPGLCFYRYDFCRRKPLDFRPVPTLDTGGGNWKPLYSHLRHLPVPNVFHRYSALFDGGDKQRDHIEYFGDWLHTINASGWKPSAVKDILVEDFLSAH